MADQLADLKKAGVLTGSLARRRSSLGGTAGQGPDARPEFPAAAWGPSVFIGVFLSEETQRPPRGAEGAA